VIIPIRPLLALRSQHADQTLLDYITLAHLAPDPGAITVRELQARWHCSQPQVSRRLNDLAAAGLADITPGWGAYQVHAVTRLEVAA
jgi:DNA-binding MarR family transcriptional regulator